MWLTSYDIDSRWGPVEANLIGRASIGTRTDWAWALLEPPIQIDGQSRNRVLLGARHQGGSVWSEPDRWPVHVYVCVPNESDSDETASHFDRDQVTIEYWGLLHQTRARAELDEY